MSTETLDYSQISLYNTQHVTDSQSRQLFVARKKLLDLLLNSILSNNKNAPPAHHLIIGQRGMGKTTLLKRIEVELRTQPVYNGFIPLLFPEEQYNLDNLTTFWLNCIDALADMLEKEGNTDFVHEIDQEVKQLVSMSVEDRAKRGSIYFKHIIFNLGRRPVLLIDNINLVLNRLKPEEQHALRSYLTEDGAAIIIGASSTQIDDISTYNAAFYDAFHVHYLKKLTSQELNEILNNLATVTGQGDLKQSIRKNSPRLKAINQLTGGNPRTAVILFKQIIQGFSDDITKDLEGILDAQTPLYKAKFEELPKSMQIIVNAIAMHWDPVTLEQIRESTQMDNGQISPQLKRLGDFGWISRPKSARGKGGKYEISERMFNIWFLMRQSSRRLKKRVACLSKYMEVYFEKGNELSIMLKQMIRTQFTDEKHAITALALAKLTEDRETRWELHEKTRRYIMEHPEISDTFELKDLYDGVDEHISALNRAIENKEAQAIVYHATPIYEAGITSIAPILAQALIDTCLFAKAKEVINKIENINEKYNLLIDLVVSVHDHESYASPLIEECCKDAIACGDIDSEAYFYYAQFLLENGRPDDALTLIRKGDKVFPKDERLYDSFGVIFYYKGDYPQAEHYLTSLEIDSEEKQWNNRFFLGIMRYEQKRYPEAIEYLKAAVEKAPNVFPSRVWLSLSLLLNGEKEEAMSCFDKVLTIIDSPVTVANIISQTLIEDGQYDALSDYLHKMMERWPDNADVQYLLAESYFFQEAFSEAATLLDSFIQENPDDALALYLRGLIFWQSDDNYDMASSYIQKSLKIEESSVKYRMLGIIEKFRENFIESARCFQKALDFDPDDVSSMISLSELYEYQTNHIEEACRLAECANKKDSSIAPYRLVNLYRDGLKNIDKAGELMKAIPEENRSDIWEAIHVIISAIHTNDLILADNNMVSFFSKFDTEGIERETMCYLYAKCIELGYGDNLLRILENVGVKEFASPDYYAIQSIISGEPSSFFDTIAKEVREVGLTIVRDVSFFIRITKAPKE